ncbi:MAG: hypothetical protein J6X88_08870 [Bacteroidales bacterium]|nr:hypothetical protein [Bacteroidales bacterium]
MKKIIIALVLLVAVNFLTSCKSKGNLTPIEQSVDGLIDITLHMHKAECIEVLLVDSDGNILADREGHWSNGKGEYRIKSSSNDEICPGQLLYPVLAIACMKHCGVEPETMVAVGAKEIDGVDVYDSQIKRTPSGMVVDSLPLYSALHSSVAIVELCRTCFPSIDELKAAIMLYLPGSRIREGDYIKLCQGEGRIEVPQQSMVNFICKYYNDLNGDSLGAVSFRSIYKGAKKSEGVEERCLICSENAACLCVFKKLNFPGAQSLADEIINTQK